MEIRVASRSIPVIPKMEFRPGMKTRRIAVTAGARTPSSAGFPASDKPRNGFPGVRLMTVSRLSSWSGWTKR